MEVTVAMLLSMLEGTRGENDGTILAWKPAVSIAKKIREPQWTGAANRAYAVGTG